MEDRAYCKINVALNVLRRREDGYHDLQSVMLPLELHDVLSIDKSDTDSYECNVDLAFNEKNTIVKAINIFRDKYQINDHFKVKVEKNIPMEAGLAGGSSNGASVFRLLSKMYQLDIENDVKELCHRIGSDVIFTYYNKPAVVYGTGEELAYFALKKSYYVLLVKPKEGVSTRDAYQTLNLEACLHPDCEKLRFCLENGLSIDGLLANSLEESALRLCPAIGNIKNCLMSYGLKNVLMSGSGSCVFALSEDENELKQVYEKIKDSYFFVSLSRVLFSC